MSKCFQPLQIILAFINGGDSSLKGAILFQLPQEIHAVHVCI